MSSNTLIGTWSYGVWSSLSEPCNVSALTISGYATQVSTLGRLNSLTTTCFSGVGYAGPGTFDFDASPDLTSDELAIIEQMFLVSFYNNLARANMGVGGDGIPWTRLREEGSTVERSNPSNLGKEYREMAKTAAEQLTYLVNAYRNSQGGSIPRDVEYLSIEPYGAGSYWVH